MNDARLVDAPDERVRDYYEHKKLNEIARSIQVPVNDEDVRKQLRSLAQPAELQRETKAQRRQRLIEILARQKSSLEDQKSINKERKPKIEADNGAHLHDRITEGLPELANARKSIAERVSKIRSQQSSSHIALKGCKLELQASQSGFLRPVTSVRVINPELVVTGDWSGRITVLALEDAMPTVASTAISAISGLSVHDHLISSGCMDGTVFLHELPDRQSELTELTKLSGHRSRVSSVEFHPVQNLLVSASYDNTWRLWDYEAEKCLLEQDGHIQGIHTVKISADGSLVASGGLDKETRIWDLRSGVCVTTLREHAREVVSAAWSPIVNEPTMTLATGSADDRCLIWDLRNPSEHKCAIYAHTSTVSDIVFDKTGESLLTSSLDGTIKVWNALNDYRLVNTLESGTRITSIDASASSNGAGTYVVAGRWDKLIDLYSDF